MTAYLSANLRHTDKRLQQSGPAVVVLRHHVRARRGSVLMNIYEVGGVMTSCSDERSAPCWAVFSAPRLHLLCTHLQAYTDSEIFSG